ncbi:Di-copper centre-containing protein [Serendipita vermifera]|nr:Di-copper centre-containing protein [Serendipita vermifera]
MTIITTGVQGGNLVARQEIRVFAKDRELMELYLQGLQRFQAVDQANPLSWFQIAGIHGRPYIPYDGAGTASASRAFAGYCSHSSILFPPWHRPYLALFEQTLAKHVNDIANAYQGDQKARYVAAAARFRIPYWDWAANADLPDFISLQTTVTVNTPTGTQTFPNPLYQYTFHPVYSTFGDGLPDEKTWESWQSTLRYPTATNARGQSNANALERTLQNNRLTIRDRTYNLLTRSTAYGPFSNDESPPTGADPGDYDSLESIHGQLHGLCGANGHMGVVDYAAFDPLFWLHHTNVDRIFALWQALNPNAYVISQTNRAEFAQGYIAKAKQICIDANSPLAPFWRAQGQYWTSEGVRDTRTLNYTYPELEKWSTLNPTQKASRLKTDINAMYGRSAPLANLVPELFQTAQSRASVPVAAVASAKPSTGAASAAKPAQQVLQAPGAFILSYPAAASSAAAAVTSAASSAVKTATATAAKAAQVVTQQAPAGELILMQRGKGNTDMLSLTSAPRKSAEHTDFSAADDPVLHDGKHYLEWVANITVEKYAAKSTFFVHIFLGDFNSDPSQWREDPNLVGTHVIFANNLAVTGCQRCQEAAAQHKLVTGTIPLTGALGDRLGAAKVRGMSPAQVAPYLQKELHWRIQRNDGSVIERTELPGLKVAVAHFAVGIPEAADQFPTWGHGQKDTSVTAGRPGGAGDDD